MIIVQRAPFSNYYVKKLTTTWELFRRSDDEQIGFIVERNNYYNGYCISGGSIVNNVRELSLKRTARAIYGVIREYERSGPGKSVSPGMESRSSIRGSSSGDDDRRFIG